MFSEWLSISAEVSSRAYTALQAITARYKRTYGVFGNALAAYLKYIPRSRGVFIIETRKPAPSVPVAIAESIRTIVRCPARCRLAATAISTRQERLGDGIGRDRHRLGRCGDPGSPLRAAARRPARARKNTPVPRDRRVWTWNPRGGGPPREGFSY